MFTEERIGSRTGRPANEFSSQEAAAQQTLRVADTSEELGETRIAFKPYRTPFLVAALIVFGLTLLDVWANGTDEPIWLWGVIKVPGFALTVVLFGGTVWLLGLFGWSCLSIHEVVLDDLGIILPKHGRLTWDRIAEVRAYGLALGGIIGMTRLTLTDKRRIYVQWFQTGCRSATFCEAIQRFYERAHRQPEVAESGPTAPHNQPLGVASSNLSPPWSTA